MDKTVRFCILVGSARTKSNSYGIAKWVNNQLVELLKSSTLNTCKHDISIIDPLTKPHPVQPLLYEIPAFVTDTKSYTSEEVREWSTYIQSCDAVIIVSPEYNANVPSTVKLALDVLYFEWSNKPAATVTFGSQGGGNVDEQLRKVMKCVKMDVIEETVQVKVSGQVIGSGERVNENDSLLDEYKDVLKVALERLIFKIENRTNVGTNDVTD